MELDGNPIGMEPKVARRLPEKLPEKLPEGGLLFSHKCQFQTITDDNSVQICNMGLSNAKSYSEVEGRVSAVDA